MMDMTITEEMAAETLAADNTAAALAERRAALAAQLAEVDAQLQAREAAERKSKRSEALKSIKSMMAFAKLTADDLAKEFGKRPVTRMSPGEPKPSALTGIKLPPKYRHWVTGETWSGRGLQPKWLKARLAAGDTLEQFRVA